MCVADDAVAEKAYVRFWLMTS